MSRKRKTKPPAGFDQGVADFNSMIHCLVIIWRHYGLPMPPLVRLLRRAADELEATGTFIDPAHPPYRPPQVPEDDDDGPEDESEG